MTHRERLAAFGVAAALAFSVQNARAEVVTYSVYPVRASIEDHTVVGSSKRGVACLKNGTLRWSAFVLRGEQAAADVALVLASAGVSAAALDPVLGVGKRSDTRTVMVEIVAMTADVCQQQYGLLKLGSKGLKGRGTMTVHWRVLGRVDENGSEIDRTTTADFNFATPDKSLGSVLKAGLAANAVKIALELPH